MRKSTSIELAPLTGDVLPAVKDLLLPLWDRAWDDDVSERILRWRFIDQPDGEGLVAFDGDRCVTMMDSRLVQYTINDELCQVRETADWYTRAEYRGAGLEPMWRMMRRPEPCISAGGTVATRDLLPRLGWKPMPQRHMDFFLPVKASGVLEGIFRRSDVPGRMALAHMARFAGVPTGRVRRQDAPGSEANVRRLSAADFPDDVVPAGDSYGLARLVDARELAWLQAAPREMGEYGALAFYLEGEPVGVAVYRLLSRTTCLEARILHIQARNPSVPLYAWMASEAASYVVRRGVVSVRCRTTSPQLTEALLNTGFHQIRAPNPLWWWSRKGEPPQAPAALSFLRADDGICPYPTNLEAARNQAIPIPEPSEPGANMRTLVSNPIPR